MIDYDPHSWRSHLFDIRGSMAREIIVRVTLFTLWSVVVVLIYNFLVRQGVMERWSPHHSVHGLVGTALGLLLVFAPIRLTIDFGKDESCGEASSTKLAIWLVWR